MINLLIHHVASGQAFFSGLLLICVGVILSFTKPGRARNLVRTVLVWLGAILIAISATPLHLASYVAGAITLIGWLVVESTARPRFSRTKPVLRSGVLALCGLGLALEIPYHLPMTVPWRVGTPIDVLGDSLTAGMGREREKWPTILSREYGLMLRDHSQAGATVSSARTIVETIPRDDSLVIVELGGNDILGQTDPHVYERGLDAILSRLRSAHRTVVVLELPLPPFANPYGEIQRRLSRKHGALLVPKRLLLGVLTTKDATLDSIHLSQAGHQAMATAIGNLLRPIPPNTPVRHVN